MNLASLITSRRQRTYSYNGYEFTRLQTLLYDLFVEALEEGRRLLLPSDILPRQSGKSVVLQKLSCNYGLYVLRNGAIVRYDAFGNEDRVRRSSLRGMRIDTVLIDEPTSFSAAQQKGAFDYLCLGYKNFDIDQSFKTLVDIATVELEVDELRREGTVYEYHRENQNSRNQELYSREFSTSWRREGV